MPKYNAKTGDGHAPGGLGPAMKRNPNYEQHGPNDSPCGPYPHLMGYEGDGGMCGAKTAKGKHGETFHWK